MGKVIEEVASHYGLSHVREVSAMSGGLIHSTWRITAHEGIFTLQKVSGIFAPSVMEDIEAVLAHLSQSGFVVPRVVRTTAGKAYVPDDKGFWRMYTYLPGVVYEAVPNESVAGEAGRLLGAYHRTLNKNFTYAFKHVRPVKHNIPMLFEAYKRAVAGKDDPEIREFLPVINRMISLDLPRDLRKTVNHGDAKISNFIFDIAGVQAVAIIDLDDCGKNYNALHEIGGAFRSWMWKSEEGRISFDLGAFEAALGGYAEGTGDFLLPREWDLIPRAIELNILELISRFVRDYYEDSYFSWDPSRYPSRKAANLSRAAEHLEFYRDAVSKRDEISAIVDKIRHQKS